MTLLRYFCLVLIDLLQLLTFHNCFIGSDLAIHAYIQILRLALYILVEFRLTVWNASTSALLFLRKRLMSLVL